MTPAARLPLATAALSLCLLAPACQNDEHGGGGTNVTTDKQNKVKLPPPKQMNQVSAQEKLKEAEQAENEGKFSHALECYEQLRSYPEAARPKDLDARIKRVEAKVNAPQ